MIKGQELPPIAKGRLYGGMSRRTFNTKFVGQGQRRARVEVIGW